MTIHCLECGADWQMMTCLDAFHQMLAWEFENADGAGSVHHLSVLCYNLQHPSVYSPDALHEATHILTRYILDGASPQQIRADYRSHTDTFKIKGTPTAHGVYAHPIQWTLTAVDVVAGGLTGYCERVYAWSRAVHEALLKSGNLA